MKGKQLLVALVVAMIGGWATSGFSQCEDLAVSNQSTKEVLPGVVLTWDSSYHCLEAPTSGDYSIEVTVSNHASSSQSVTISDVRLFRVTPRTRFERAGGTIEAIGGLPVTIPPGASASFTVEGSYTMVLTDQGEKANLHLRAHGSGGSTGVPFRLGINVHVRGPGATL